MKITVDLVLSAWECYWGLLQDFSSSCRVLQHSWPAAAPACVWRPEHQTSDQSYTDCSLSSRLWSRISSAQSEVDSSLLAEIHATDYRLKKSKTISFTSKFCLSSNCRDEQEYSEHTSSEVLCGCRVCIVIYDRYISPRVFLGVHSADAGREKDYENSLEM